MRKALTSSRVCYSPSAAMSHSWSGRGHGESIAIPAPTGELPVGCIDLMHQFEGDKLGGLLVRLFYPAQLGSAPPSYTNWTSHSKYLQAYLHFQRTWGPGLKAAAVDNPLLNPKIPAVLGADLYIAHSTPGARAVTELHTQEYTSSTSLPVIVYCHGLGGMRCDNSAICCDFASHGYLVAAVEHRDQSACSSLQRVPSFSSERSRFRDEWIEFYYHPNPAKEFQLRNRQVLQRSRDGILALELLTMLNEGVEVHNMMEGHFDFRQFQGRLDLRKAAIMGHSFGGATTIQALSQDHRFQCGIAMDCWMLPIHPDLLETGVTQPLLFINSSDFQWAENVRAMFQLSHSSKNDSSLRPTTTSIITLKGTSHGNQSDMQFLSLFSELRAQFPSSLDPYAAFRINVDLCHAFYKRHLLRDPAYQGHVANLDGGEGQSEHILFGSNLPISKQASKL
jgi:platelet-activating factor acetylhydrolase